MGAIALVVAILVGCGGSGRPLARLAAVGPAKSRPRVPAPDAGPPLRVLGDACLKDGQCAEGNCTVAEGWRPWRGFSPALLRSWRWPFRIEASSARPPRVEWTGGPLDRLNGLHSLETEEHEAGRADGDGVARREGCA
jgi:hypothetical protein